MQVFSLQDGCVDGLSDILVMGIDGQEALPVQDCFMEVIIWSFDSWFSYLPQSTIPKWSQ
jgi:hypothetical protein